MKPYQVSYLLHTGQRGTTTRLAQCSTEALLSVIEQFGEALRRVSAHPSPLAGLPSTHTQGATAP